ncbi:pancreatic triacylglycerol lipase-like isoform X2 [Physella acuta]|nr:pancreatic triacylglycerol lipase-like isoform X2 [Physella acuta]
MLCHLLVLLIVAASVVSVDTTCHERFDQCHDSLLSTSIYTSKPNFACRSLEDYIECLLNVKCEFTQDEKIAHDTKIEVAEKQIAKECGRLNCLHALKKCDFYFNYDSRSGITCSGLTEYQRCLLTMECQMTTDENVVHGRRLRFVKQELKMLCDVNGQLPMLRKGITSNMICYHAEINYGCFDNYSPYNNARGSLPDPPESLRPNVLFYTRNTSFSVPIEVGNQKLKTVTSSLKDDQTTFFITHGFGTAINPSWMEEMKDELLAAKEARVIIIDWSHGSAIPNYMQAAANLRLVAKMASFLIQDMVELNLNLANVHLIGHSLGAHLMGEVGKAFKGQIGRITGLDPAALGFDKLNATVRLDPTDAKFVDVIHTDMARLSSISLGLGAVQAMGHVDFYPNGGMEQPGCNKNVLNQYLKELKEEECNHARAIWLFIDSINTAHACMGYGCVDYTDFLSGNCGFNCYNKNCSHLGMSASPEKGLGRMYLATSAASPYCGCSSWTTCISTMIAENERANATNENICQRVTDVFACVGQKCHMDNTLRAGVVDFFNRHVQQVPATCVEMQLEKLEEEHKDIGNLGANYASLLKASGFTITAGLVAVYLMLSSRSGILV